MPWITTSWLPCFASTVQGSSDVTTSWSGLVALLAPDYYNGHPLLLKGRLIMLVLLDGSMWEGAPLYTCSHTKTSVTDVTSRDYLQHLLTTYKTCYEAYISLNGEVNAIGYFNLAAIVHSRPGVIGATRATRYKKNAKIKKLPRFAPRADLYMWDLAG